jgi:hypothetical protein
MHQYYLQQIKEFKNGCFKASARGELPTEWHLHAPASAQSAFT